MSGNQPDTNPQKTKSVLITGGSGMIGMHLTSALLAKDYKVSHLSRNSASPEEVPVFKWDPEQNIADPQIFEGIDYIIHLAGANIGAKRWTDKRKEEIINSRAGSAAFIYRVIADNKIPIKAFISASATGYYGSTTTEKIFKEDDPPGNDFMGLTCVLWEKAADLFAEHGIRTVKIRSSVVLEKNDSALTKIMKPARFGFLARTGSGNQYMPWIHIEDLCRIYIKAIEDSNMNGAYNASAPEHCTHKIFISKLAEVIKRPVFPAGVPEFVLKILFGEMSAVILEGSRISSEKIIASGYNFKHKALDEALRDIFR
jgi:uncharacterized protein (TIGR01777 family)